MTRVARAGIWLDERRVLWLGILTLIVLGLIGGGAWVMWTQAGTKAHTAKLEAVHESDVRTAYARCLGSIQTYAAFETFLSGLKGVADVEYRIGSGLVDSSARTLAAAPGNDPLSATRRRNLGDWLNIRSDAALARTQVNAFDLPETPTEADCAASSGIPDGLRHR